MASNYGAIAKSLTQQNVALHAANVEASPDYGMIAEEAIKGRSAERKAAIAAESAVRQTGIKGKATVEAYKLDAKTKKEVADIKKPAKRFAGVVGAAGTIAGAYATKIDSDKSKAEQLAYQQRSDARFEEMMSKYENRDSEPYKPSEQLTQMGAKLGVVYQDGKWVKDPNHTLDLPYPNAGKPTAESPSTPGTNGGTKTSGDGSVTSSLKLTQSQIKDKFKSRGFDDATSHLWSAIAMQESSGRTGAHNDGTNTNSVEDSHGLLQINLDAHMDKLTKRGWTKEDLKDPDKNIDIAIEVYEEVGGKFTPWGGYTDGGYKQYL